MDNKYHSLTGRIYDLSLMNENERAFLEQVFKVHSGEISWIEFSRFWINLGRKRLWKRRSVPVRNPVYRICQDLAARLGIREGLISEPGYREILADLIDSKFRSRYEFCRKTGIDQAHLSRVLAGRSDFSPDTLFKMLEILGVKQREIFEPAFRACLNR